MLRQAGGRSRKNYTALMVFIGVWLGLAALTAVVLPANASNLMQAAQGLLQLVDAQVLLILIPFVALLLFVLAQAASLTVAGARHHEARPTRRRLSWTRS